MLVKDTADRATHPFNLYLLSTYYLPGAVLVLGRQQCPKIGEARTLEELTYSSSPWVNPALSMFKISLGLPDWAQWIRIHLPVQGTPEHPWFGKIPHPVEQLRYSPQLLNPSAETTEKPHPLVPVQRKKPPQ